MRLSEWSHRHGFDAEDEVAALDDARERAREQEQPIMTEPTEVYAVPGAHSIIDQINPGTGQTYIYAETAEQVHARYPGAVRMTWETWQAEQAARQHTPITWQPTTAERYDEMLNVLPPALWLADAFLVGEPQDHDYSNGQPRFDAYWQRHGRYYASSRPMTRAELRAEVDRVRHMNAPLVTDPALIREAMEDTITGIDLGTGDSYSVTVYRCTRHGLQPAKLDPKTHKPKVRAFRTGFVARFLQCGCSIPVSQTSEPRK